MPRKSAIFLSSALVSASLAANPLAANAGTLSQIGTKGGNAALSAALSCGGFHSGSAGMSGGPQIFAPISVNNQSVNVMGSSGVNNNVNVQNFNVQNNGGNTNIVNKPINVQTNIDNSKSIDVNKPVTVNKNVDTNKPVTVNKKIDVNKPVTVNNNNINVKNIAINKSVDINKPVTINKTINENKNININKNINDNKNININKNINDNKNININKTINDNKNININKNVNININTNTNNNINSNNTTVSSVSYSSASAYADSSSNAASSSLGGGDISVSAEEQARAVDYVAKGGQCSFVDATVVKAIHAVCVSADGREFPASHMVGTSWIASGYEGEIARCLPGSTLKVSIGSVVQSDQGMATSMANAQILSCGVHQAVRHYKDGMLKCAPAEKVVDCTERTNLRKWGTGDMFFSYVTKVCLDETKVGGQSRETSDQAAVRARQAYSRIPAQSSRYGYGSADATIDHRTQAGN